MLRSPPQAGNVFGLFSWRQARTHERQWSMGHVMKRKVKVRRNRDGPPPDGPPPDINETVVERSRAPATPGRTSIEQVDEHKAGSIESVPQTGSDNGIAGFIEPTGSDAADAR
jgi:hypothetical protein